MPTAKQLDRAEALARRCAKIDPERLITMAVRHMVTLDKLILQEIEQSLDRMEKGDR